MFESSSLFTVEPLHQNTILKMNYKRFTIAAAEYDTSSHAGYIKSGGSTQFHLLSTMLIGCHIPSIHIQKLLPYLIDVVLLRTLLSFQHQNPFLKLVQELIVPG